MNVLLSIAIVAASVAVAIAAFHAFRRRAPAGSFVSDGDRAAGVFGVLATGFSVLLGFIVYLAFTSYDTSRSGAEQEATDVIQMYETAQFLPRSAAPDLGGELVCYGRAVVGIEWPALQRGDKPSFNPWGLKLFRTLQTIDPKTPVEQAAYAKWLDQTSDREQARLDRVRAGSGIIPGPLWLILAVSAGLVLLFAFVFADSGEGHIVQTLLIGTVTAMLVTSLLVIRFLNDPYHPGYGSLEPVAMQRVLGQIDQATRSLHIRVHIPCNATGQALAAPAATGGG